MHQPKLLILDEPTAGVDVELRLELWEFLRSSMRDGMTIFLTSHYLEEAEKLCSRIGDHRPRQARGARRKDKLIAKHGRGSLQDVFLELVGKGAEA